jgi:molybdenum cofactor cytidylyltransferase
LIGGIILAAGFSTRMGQQKLLLPVHGEPMVARVARAAIEAGLSPVIVVTGSDHEAVRDAVASVGGSCLRNPEPELGMLSSVRIGLAAMPDDCAAVAVLLGDQPSVSASLVAALTQEYEASGAGIVVPTFAGRRGHPLIFSLRFRDAVMTRYDDTGLRGLLQENANVVRELACDDVGVVIDVDTPEQYEAETKRLGSHS